MLPRMATSTTADDDDPIPVLFVLLWHGVGAVLLYELSPASSGDVVSSFPLLTPACSADNTDGREMDLWSHMYHTQLNELYTQGIGFTQSQFPTDG